jgi:deoxyribodipyrimidine photolyase-related protein
MSQFADAGRLASKPYIASANYINKMSDSCKSCRYDPKEKYGENACPLNYLYWAFVDSNRDEFIRGRQPFILNQLPKLDLERLHQQKAHFLARVGDSGTLP